MIGKRVIITGKHPRKHCTGEVKFEAHTIIGPMWYIKLDDGNATLAGAEFVEEIKV